MSEQLTDKLDFCLSSKELRERIREGRIKSSTGQAIVEKQIQPSSFEPRVLDEVFVLDTGAGAFLPQPDETVYRRLLELPSHARKRVSLRDGIELKVGFSYLVPLDERLLLNPTEHVRSSPKSSMGRLFLNTRLLADHNSSFDEISGRFSNDPLDLWLLVQPLAFSVILRPGDTLNQIRELTGYGAKLTAKELFEEHGKTPLVFDVDKKGMLVPEQFICGDGIDLHHDLTGEQNHGIIGLRARKNPEPIDLRAAEAYS